MPLFMAFYNFHGDRNPTGASKADSCGVYCLQIANPPLLGILAGIAVGVSPLGALIYQPNSPSALARTMRLPMELETCLGPYPAPLQSMGQHQHTEQVKSVACNISLM